MSYWVHQRQTTFYWRISENDPLSCRSSSSLLPLSSASVAFTQATLISQQRTFVNRSQKTDSCIELLSLYRAGHPNRHWKDIFFPCLRIAMELTYFDFERKTRYGTRDVVWICRCNGISVRPVQTERSLLCVPLRPTPPHPSSNRTFSNQHSQQRMCVLIQQLKRHFQFKYHWSSLPFTFLVHQFH